MIAIACTLIWVYSVTRVTRDAEMVQVSSIPSVPLLVVVASASRPGGKDYVSVLLHSIAEQSREFPAFHIHLVMFDADLSPHRRSPAWFDSLPREVEVVHASDAVMDLMATVNLDPTKDKHHDPAPRIRWRTKGAYDLLQVLSLAHSYYAKGWPYAVILQDDVQLSSQFFPRIYEMVHSQPQVLWLAWALFHAAAFDHGRVYRHGDVYRFEACDQALLYRTADMAGLIDYVRAHWREDPSDWQLRDYQRKSNAVIRVAQPSIVQHIGAVSSLASKSNGVASGCWAPDFQA